VIEEVGTALIHPENCGAVTSITQKLHTSEAVAVRLIVYAGAEVLDRTRMLRQADI